MLPWNLFNMHELDLLKLEITSLKSQINKLERLCNFLLSVPTSEQELYTKTLEDFNKNVSTVS